MSTIEQTTAGQAYRLPRDAGLTDLWWPYGPVVGRYTTKVSGEQTDGRLLQIQITESRGAGTPLHVHRDTDETFFVIEGELKIAIGDERIEAGAGDFVLAPKGVPHAFLVTSERAEFLITCASAGTPGALGYGIDGFFKEVAPAVVAGEAPPAPTMPEDAGEFARLMDVYGVDLVGPPPLM
ncbi:MAG: cupin domain-containing protein [Solirubrobacteraceae bacterium]